VETYSYDFESHMTVREASGGSTDTHEYDGDGRRMRSKLNDAADWTHFIHDELTENLICEYTLISGSFAIKALNTYGLGLISSNRQGTIRYFHFDGLGTTHHLTDSSQSVTDSYAFDAFGVPSSATGSSINPYRYVGQWGYYDDGAMGSSSEMLLLGARYYWPKYGRFLTGDAMPRANLYWYVDNSPTKRTDPRGTLPYGGINPAISFCKALNELTWQYCYRCYAHHSWFGRSLGCRETCSNLASFYYSLCKDDPSAHYFPLIATWLITDPSGCGPVVPVRPSGDDKPSNPMGFTGGDPFDCIGTFDNCMSKAVGSWAKYVCWLNYAGCATVSHLGGA
jgi:RHS repeat-associated protein